jgi:hypothetical protein
MAEKRLGIIMHGGYYEKARAQRRFASPARSRRPRGTERG